MLATSHRYQRMGSCMQPRNIWPWQPCNYEAKRVILRSVYLEEPLRMAPVCVPSGLSPLKLVERCLGINECLGAAWEALKGQEVFIGGRSQGRAQRRDADTRAVAASCALQRDATCVPAAASPTRTAGGGFPMRADCTWQQESGVVRRPARCS